MSLLHLLLVQVNHFVLEKCDQVWLFAIPKDLNITSYTTSQNVMVLLDLWISIICKSIHLSKDSFYAHFNYLFIIIILQKEKFSSNLNGHRNVGNVLNLKNLWGILESRWNFQKSLFCWKLLTLHLHIYRAVNIRFRSLFKVWNLNM